MATSLRTLQSRIQELLPELERVYTDIHAHPELSVQETRTTRAAADRLRGAGYDVTEGVGNTGVLGLLRNGDGPTVMLRADMDALPVREQTGLPYASTQTATDSTGKTVPVMHACGHDMHLTWLIGAVTALAETRDTWKGTLMPVFQPAEETGTGAQAMNVLAFVAGNAGGMTRDVLIGAVPPAAISNWQYVAASLVAGVATFIWYPNVARLQHIVLLFDAGLATFAVAGAQKALAYDVNPIAAALLGMLTGIGGGMMRDLLVKDIPVVLRADFYAVAALAGAAVVVAGHLLHWPPAPTAIAGASVCFFMRLIAIRRGWRLPVANDQAGYSSRKPD